jgi:hypothetical protein
MKRFPTNLVAHPLAHPWQSALGLAAGLLLLLSPTQAKAAETITLMVGPLNRSILVSDVEALAEGQASRGDLKTVLKFAGQSDEAAAALLNQTLPFELIQADQLLNSSLASGLLEKLGQIISPRSSNEAGAQALRAAIILSLVDDNQLSLLEVFQRYPTEMRVNVGALRQASAEFRDIPKLLQSFGR